MNFEVIFHSLFPTLGIGSPGPQKKALLLSKPPQVIKAAVIETLGRFTIDVEKGWYNHEYSLGNSGEASAKAIRRVLSTVLDPFSFIANFPLLFA